MLYVDPSLIVSSLTREARSAESQSWIENNASSLVISDWTITETIGALSRQLRMNRLTVPEHAAAVLLLERNFVQQLDVLPVRRADFRIASRFAARANTGLRASDALHLAIAHGADAILVTRDEQQARAGTALGMRTNLLA